MLIPPTINRNDLTSVVDCAYDMIQGSRACDVGSACLHLDPLCVFVHV